MALLQLTDVHYRAQIQQDNFLVMFVVYFPLQLRSATSWFSTQMSAHPYCVSTPTKFPTKVKAF